MSTKKCRCNRTDCYAYDKLRSNNCKALSSLYEDNEKCKFYKHKSEADWNEIEASMKVYEATH